VNDPRQLMLHPCCLVGISGASGAEGWELQSAGARLNRLRVGTGKPKLPLLHFIDIKEIFFTAHQRTRPFCSTYFKTCHVCIQQLQL